jgi:uncharacterized Tic20 family protein
MRELQPETTMDIHTYKLKGRVLLLNLFSLIFIGLIIGIPLFLMFEMVAASYKSETNYAVPQYVLLCVFSPIIVLTGILIIQQIFNTISLFFSDIKITPEGIEYRNWPYRHIRSRWSEVDRLGKFLFYDVVYLKSYEVIGLSLSFSKLFKFLAFSQASISLSSYKGWPGGPLASDLKHYAPQLFESQPAVGQAEAPNHDSNVSGISQEYRLLAALSHASVLFSGIGILVPLLIYFTQKKKSTFLAFHALQAFFFQLAGILFSFLSPFCILGVIFIPAFSEYLSGKFMSFEPYLGIYLIITVVITMLIVFCSLIYMIYGTIAAIQTYQGKDFRYVIIGKQIEKRTTIPGNVTEN